MPEQPPSLPASHLSSVFFHVRVCSCKTELYLFDDYSNITESKRQIKLEGSVLDKLWALLFFFFFCFKTEVWRKRDIVFSRKAKISASQHPVSTAGVWPNSFFMWPKEAASEAVQGPARSFISSWFWVLLLQDYSKIGFSVCPKTSSVVINRHHHEHHSNTLLHTGKIFSSTWRKLGFCCSSPCSCTAAFSTIPFCTGPKSISWRQPQSRAGARPLGWPKPREVPLKGDLPAFLQLTHATILQDGAGACNTFDTTCSCESLCRSAFHLRKACHSLYTHFVRLFFF